MEYESDPSLDPALGGEGRGTHVAAMFGRIATHYDRMNRLMSLGQDQRWRRRMAELARLPRGGVALDLATGTGDVARALLERDPTAIVVGADFAPPMLRVGQRRGGPRPRFVAADALALPFPPARFDALLHAFLMRNISDIPGGLREQYRVLRPGGRLVSLEIVGPSATLPRGAYRLFFERLVPILGARLAGDAAAYRYLPTSVLRFPGPDAFSTLLREAGFRAVRHERHMLGSIAIHTAVRPS